MKLKASDGRRRLTDVATTEQLLRIIQSIPSKKAEPFKMWLAQVGRERIEETIDSEITIEWALENDMLFDNNSMTIMKAAPQEYDAVRTFYFDVIDGFKGKEYHPCWEKDVYPAPEQLRSLIEKSELYVGKENGKIISAMAFNHECNEEGYSQVEWPTKAEKNEVFIIHMLATHPSRGQCGVAGIMVRFAIEQALEQNGKAIRLDVLKGNIPANKLYEAAGFRKCDTLSLYYPDTGYTDFELYELAL